HRVMRYRVATAGGTRCHAYPPKPVAADAGGNRSTIFLGPAVNQSNVGLLNFAASKLFGQLAMCFVILCDYDQPARFFVEAVNNARSHFSANSRQRREMMQQSIHQGAAIALVLSGARSRMYHHASGFVDDREI